MNYIPTIGLEIHTELNTKSKMFCSCKNDSEEKTPNTNVCPICMGHPGTLPVANREAIQKVVMTGLALNCEIAEHSKFDRKNYFYPDLPKGYQISQYDMPLCANGFLEAEGEKTRIRRIHIEEDTGKLVHPAGTDYSLVDLNRAGVPLMELVTEPDMISGLGARRFAQELQLVLRYLAVSSADMEKGQMRVEVNISLRREDTDELGTKVEIKNLNSFRAVEDSIEYEIERQTKLLEAGERVVQETRGWNQEKGITSSQREKEEAHDYRYFPEPDLPPLHFSENDIAALRARIPELPRARFFRFEREYNIPPKEAEMFVRNKELGEYFEKVVSELDPNLPKDRLRELIRLATNYLVSDLKGLMEERSLAFHQLLCTPENFAELVELIESGTITSSVAKSILPRMIETGKDPSQMVEEEGLGQTKDTETIRAAVKEILAQHPEAVGDYKKGKTNALQFLAGKVMAATRGKADPQLVRIFLEQELAKS